MRYVGQGHEITVELPENPADLLDPENLRDRYEREYTRIYHVANEDCEVEVLTWRVRVTGRAEDIPKRTLPETAAAAPLPEASKEARDAFLGEETGFQSCPIYDQYRLLPGNRFKGPAIIEERESTITIGDRSEIEIDPAMNVVVTLG